MLDKKTVPSGVPSHRMLVKVQVPLLSGGEPEYLVYNQDRTFETMIPVGSVPKLDEAMSGFQKRYFGATLAETEEGSKKYVLLINPFWPVEDQDW